MAVALSAVLVPDHLAAAECPVPAYEYKTGAAVIAASGNPVEATADRITSERDLISLDGNTTIDYLGRRLIAENAQYKADTGEVSIDGAMSFRGEGIVIESNNALFDIDDDVFETGDSVYEINLNGQRATGNASRLARTAEGLFELEDATYSTCPPGDKSWFIRARKIRLDPEEGIGTAERLTLNFKGVPLLAVPAFSFPISEKRKSGFLAPIFARGDNTGFELHLPWYWNIRPNVDATLVPRLMSRRGAQLQSELRYLDTQGMWTLSNEYLRDRERSGKRRSFSQLNHLGSFGPNWSTRIVASEVSDKDYFQDLGNSLELASITHLERVAEMRYQEGPLDALIRLQGFQTVDEAIAQTDRPYRRLPQFAASLHAPEYRLGIQASMDGEFVYFDRDDSVTGVRIDLQPRLSLPITRDAWFIEPSLSQRLTYYDLNNSGAALESSTGRSVPTFSLDSGLFFDRMLDSDGTVQTLEPRAFYLNVPYEDQNEIPLFDSSEFDFNISQLFRENRFSGGDRIADANQLSLGLTSRIISGVDGREIVRASVGQILYFEDRQVTLEPSDEVLTSNTRDTSDFVAEVAGQLSEGWFAKGNIQWNQDEEQTVRSSILVSYKPDNSRIVNVAHRNVSDDLANASEQIDLSALWPIGNSWRLAGRWNYSLDDKTSIESLLGVEYDSCCWAFRFAARRYISDEGLDHDTNLYVQLVLKGLAPVGQNYGALLENAILGYRDDYR